MECNSRARAREACGHGDQLLTLLKFAQVRGLRTLLPPACALRLVGDSGRPTDERSESV